MTQSKNKFATRQYQIANRRRRLMIASVVLVASSVVLGAFLFLGTLGPKKVKFPSSEILDNRVESSEDPDAKYQEMPNKDLQGLSTDLELEADALSEEGNYTAASAKYRQAFKLQQMINRNDPSSTQSDFSRSIRLRLKADNAAAQPLFLDSLDLEQQAIALAKAGDMDSAANTFLQAIALQETLNHEYRDTQRASTSRLMQLKSRLAEVKSGELYNAVDALLKRAISLQQAEDFETAAGFFQEAAHLQDRLNKEFPDGPHASLVRFNEFRSQAQLAQSQLSARKLQEEILQLEQLIEARTMDQAELLVAKLEQDLQAFEKAFPLSSAIDYRFKTKVHYLSRKKTHLAAVQNKVFGALLPVPNEDEKTFMLRTEVPQSLYMLLVDANPSRNPGDLHPVDSISWIEAELFCERLSWILGKTVRLPTEDEFRKALGTLDPLNAGDSIWSSSDAQGISQPVGQKEPFPGGFFDLLGNVSEWLTTDPNLESKRTLHIGGHAQDSLKTILSVPVRELQSTSRNRLVGFRIVVLD